MKSDKIVQFVFFETPVHFSDEQFTMHWEQYTRSDNGNSNINLQRSQKNGLFRYIAQHRLASNSAEFVFEKARRSSRIPEIEIRAKKLGGYSVLQLQRMNDAHGDETKVFAFFSQAPSDLDVYRQLSAHGKLNIYEAYYENCRYAYILEFFTNDRYVSELLLQLQQNKPDEVGAYKEFALQES